MAISLEFSVTGLDAIDKALAALGDRAAEALLQAVHDEAENVMGDSKAHYVPVDTSTLQNSGYVEPAALASDGTVSCRLAYGGPAEAYAIAVHEHLSEFSPWSWKRAEELGHGVHFTQGGPKYLEKPFVAAEDGYADRVADRLKRALGT